MFLFNFDRDPHGPDYHDVIKDFDFHAGDRIGILASGFVNVGASAQGHLLVTHDQGAIVVEGTTLDEYHAITSASFYNSFFV